MKDHSFSTAMCFILDFSANGACRKSDSVMRSTSNIVDSPKVIPQIVFDERATCVV